MMCIDVMYLVLLVIAALIGIAAWSIPEDK